MKERRRRASAGKNLKARVLLALLVVWSGLGLTFVPTRPATAGGTGTITGRVTSPAQPGGVANVLVYSYDLDRCVADIAVTDTGGNYVLDNMETGRFVVRFETRRASRAYLDQWSGEVSVIDGRNTSGIDAVLQAGTDGRMRAAVIMGSGAGKYDSAVKVGNYLEGKGLEVEWLLSGDAAGTERSGVDYRVLEEGLSGCKIIYYTGHGIYYGNLPDCRVGGFYAFEYFVGYPELSRIDFADDAVVLFNNACFTAGSYSNPYPVASTDQQMKNYIAMYSNDFMGWERGDYQDAGSWKIDYSSRNLGFALYYADNYGVTGVLEKLFSSRDYRMDELIDAAWVEDPYRYNDDSDPGNPMGGDYRMLLPADAGNVALVGDMSLTTRDIIPLVPAPEVPAGYGHVYYFAEGYTGSFFREYLTIGNPTTVQAGVQVLFMLNEGDWQVTQVTVPPGSRTTMDVNSVIGRDKEVSMRVSSDQAVVAERPMYFNKNGITGGSTVMGATAPGGSWYFAEGYTGYGFEEYVCVLNPGKAAAGLTFRFQTQEAGEVVKTGFSVPPLSRATFRVNDILGEGYQNSLKLEASQPVVAERPIYFSYRGGRSSFWSGGGCVMGATSLYKSYYFAEGTTRDTFDEWLTLQNPGAAPITVNAVYQLGPGQGSPVTRSYKVDPGRRSTVFVPDEVGRGKDVSVQLTSGSAFLAERPCYFNYNGVWTGGHCVIGSPSTGAEWFLAEGYTGNGFDEWLTLQNPGDAEAVVEVDYFTQEDGALAPRTVKVPAQTRVTVKVNDDAGPGYQLSARLHVKSGPGIVVERPMYFLYNGSWDGGHDVVASGL